MADIFGYTSGIRNPGFSDDGNGGSLISGVNGTYDLIQNWSVQYNLNVTPLYECGTSTVTWSAKHGSGTLQIGRIIHEDPSSLVGGLGTACSPVTPNITAFDGCKVGGAAAGGAAAGGATAVVLKLVGCVATSIGFSGQSQNAHVSEDITAQFASLEIGK